MDKAFRDALEKDGRGAALKARMDAALRDSDEARARMNRPGKVRVIA
jgi:hypothetical protein